MAINLVKGQKLNLEKKSPEGLGEILINLNWMTKHLVLKKLYSFTKDIHIWTKPLTGA